MCTVFILNFYFGPQFQPPKTTGGLMSPSLGYFTHKCNVISDLQSGGKRGVKPASIGLG
jgi:hypothetical protein